MQPNKPITSDCIHSCAEIACNCIPNVIICVEANFRQGFSSKIRSIIGYSDRDNKKGFYNYEEHN